MGNKHRKGGLFLYLMHPRNSKAVWVDDVGAAFASRSKSNDVGRTAKAISAPELDPLQTAVQNAPR